MIPSRTLEVATLGEVYQRGLVIDSQLAGAGEKLVRSVSKGIGD